MPDEMFHPFDECSSIHPSRWIRRANTTRWSSTDHAFLKMNAWKDEERRHRIPYGIDRAAGSDQSPHFRRRYPADLLFSTACNDFNRLLHRGEARLVDVGNVLGSIIVTFTNIFQVREEFTDSVPIESCCTCQTGSSGERRDNSPL